jgi:hypothetical protein
MVPVVGATKVKKFASPAWLRAPAWEVGEPEIARSVAELKLAPKSGGVRDRT